jgi:hypothetical protein
MMTPPSVFFFLIFLVILGYSKGSISSCDVMKHVGIQKHVFIVLYPIYPMMFKQPQLYSHLCAQFSLSLYLQRFWLEYKRLQGCCKGVSKNENGPAVHCANKLLCAISYTSWTSLYLQKITVWVTTVNTFLYQNMY